MVFTGGDPLKRPDIFALLRRSVELGLRTNIGPSATPLLTKETIRGFRECGLVRMAIGVDGPDARTWSVFFLVVTGRALAGDHLTVEEYEQVFENLYKISRAGPFEVKTTEGMHYRRYLARRLRKRPEPADSNPRFTFLGKVGGDRARKSFGVEPSVPSRSRILSPMADPFVDCKPWRLQAVSTQPSRMRRRVFERC
jgi:MoaA/NifB/PqqE/SkfB family radical SAM enzyme